MARFDGYGFLSLDHESTPNIADDDIRCLFQDSTGALWIGTATGLTRYRDGQTRIFKGNGLPEGAVRSLLETSDHKLWVLTTQGLASASLQNATDIAFHPAPGTPVDANASIVSIASTKDGTLWIATSQGLRHIASTRMQAVPAPLAQTSIEVMAPSLDGHSLLVATASSLWRLDNGHATPIDSSATLPLEGIRSILETTDGIWLKGRSTATLLRTQGNLVYSAGRELPGTQITSLKRDKQGAIWIGTNTGLARFANGKLQIFDGNSSAILTTFEDEEGDLWVGTETSGVTILRDRVFQVLPDTQETPDAPATAILQSAEGAIWFGTNGAGLRHAGAASVTTKEGLASDIVLALALGVPGSGDLWIGTPDGLNLLHDKKLQLFTSSDGLADDLVRSILPTHDGSVWVGSRRGVTRLDHGKTEILTREQGLGSDLVGPLLEDEHADLWIGTAYGLTRLHNGALRDFTISDGLPGNTITTLERSTGGGFWIGTEAAGLGRWTGEKFVSYAAVPAIPRAVYASLEDHAGSLWLASDHGIFRVSIADLDRYTRDPRSDVSVIHYSTADGIPSMNTSGSGYPSAWRLSDGRLCFTTRHGIVTVNPSPLPHTLSPPHIAIENVTVDDHNVAPATLAALPPTSSHLAFTFAGISFAAPQRVQYRYMLQGLDRDWIDAGTNRIAYYTNISHGKYVFRVCARYAGGVWSQPQELSFALRPYAYQTLWFRLLILFVLAAFGFALYGLRMRSLQMRFRAVTAERSRMAREIHDTLAQSFVAVSVRLEIMGQLLRSSDGIEKCRMQLDQTRTLVRESLSEARRSIWDLRAEDGESQSLPARLARLAQEARQQIADVHQQTTGTYRPLTQRVEDELVRIAGEAISNAIRHAKAKRLRLALLYDLEALSLEVQDDGKGFEVLQAPSRKEGHFGLTGMQERALLLGAHVTIESTPGNGTLVRVSLPLPVNSEAKERS